MAKFSGKNIEFKNNQKAIFGSGDDSSIYWDGTDLNISTTVKGVDPTKSEHLTTKNYVDTTISGTLHPSILQFSGSPTYNGSVFLLGWDIQVRSGVSLVSGAPITTITPIYDSYIVLNVLTTVGAPFTINISGTVSDDSTGTYSQESENITVSGVAHYHSTKQFVNAPVLSIVEASKSCTLNISKVMHWNFAYRDFILTGACIGWVPDQNNWSIDLTIYHHASDGHSHVVDNIYFSNTDTVLRAAANVPGKYLRADYNRFVEGSGAEGITVLMDQSGIGDFRLELYYEGT